MYLYNTHSAPENQFSSISWWWSCPYWPLTKTFHAYTLNKLCSSHISNPLHMISSDFVKNLWNKWRFNVSLMLFVTVDTPDPYLILRIKTAPEGRRRTKTKDNEVNPVWNEEFTFFLDGAVDNKLRMFTNPWQIVSIICSPLDVKNCRLFCLHRVFSLKGWGEGYLRRLHCKCDGKPSPHSLLSICVSTIHQVRGKRRKKLCRFAK